MNPTEFAIRVRLDNIGNAAPRYLTDAIRAVLDLPECRDTGHMEYLLAAIAEHLGVSDARCVRCGGEGPFNGSGWCQDCASPVYT